MAEIKGEVAQTLFEFLHMGLLSYYTTAHGKDAKVSEYCINIVSIMLAVYYQY